MEYENYLREKIKNDKKFKEMVKNLKGENLKCFCSNGKTSRKTGSRWCHGHILLEYAELLNK